MNAENDTTFLTRIDEACIRAQKRKSRTMAVGRGDWWRLVTLSRMTKGSSDFFYVHSPDYIRHLVDQARKNIIDDIRKAMQA